MKGKGWRRKISPRSTSHSPGGGRDKIRGARYRIRDAGVTPAYGVASSRLRILLCFFSLPWPFLHISAGFSLRRWPAPTKGNWLRFINRPTSFHLSLHVTAGRPATGSQDPIIPRAMQKPPPLCIMHPASCSLYILSHKGARLIFFVFANFFCSGAGSRTWSPAKVPAQDIEASSVTVDILGIKKKVADHLGSGQPHSFLTRRFYCQFTLVRIWSVC